VSKPIESYALIGNCYTAALVGLDGSIDWLCLPHFASGACFAALLGTPENGNWQIAPVGPYTAQRRYRGDTMILETTFTTPDGNAATVVDFLPRPNEDEGAAVDLVRIVRPVRGTVTLRSDVAFRFDYGHVRPWVQQYQGGIKAVAGPDAVVLRTPVVLRGENFRTLGEVTVTEGGGDQAFVLTYFASHLPPPPEVDPVQMEAAAEHFWTEWAGRYQGTHQYRDAVMRSLLALKAMTYEPTGGIVAAPTTSLPEQLGGVRNWDYRFCWIRDATLTLYSFLSCGYVGEADAWRQWLLRAAAGSPEDLQIMYGIRGQRRLEEVELQWLDGYGGSRPVRVGNGAHDQFQLDVYGELMGALHLARTHESFDGDFDGWHLQRSLMRFVEQNWDQPDNGIWEVRGGRRQFTHSKVMAWMAVDRSIRDVEQFGLEAPVEQWRQLRDTIHADVCEHGFNKEKNAFVQYYGGQALDAALLMIPTTGFLPATDPRFVGTVAAVERELLVDGTFVLRYQSDSGVDGLPGGEAAFLPCAFWLANAYALTGRRADATALFERLLALRNDVGLISEEYDPTLKRLLGNFPQAFTHVALIATAALLAGEEGAHDPMKHEGGAGVGTA
jgi:GH15 family glucan-1,4-alpha-glucosidase